MHATLPLIATVPRASDNSIRTTWRTCRTSIDTIETDTGIDILSAVPVAIRQTIDV